MFCPQCGHSHDAPTRFCSSCGFHLETIAATQAATVTKSVAPSAQDDLYRAVIGEKNQPYYLRQFKALELADARKGSWHWPAFFFTFYWLLYRKMWLYALIYLCIPYLVGLLLGVSEAGGESQSSSTSATLGLIYFLFIVGLWILPALYANSLYYRACRKKIEKVISQYQDVATRLEHLRRAGGTSNALIFVVLAVPVIGILAAVALPAYQDYTVRARLSEAMAVGASAEAAVEEHFKVYKTVPQSLDEAGFQFDGRSTLIRRIEVDAGNGTIVITMAVAPIDGKALLLIPSQDSSGSISWRCTSKEIPAKYLPAKCRN